MIAPAAGGAREDASLLARGWAVLTPAQKRRVTLAQLASVAMAFSTVVGIAAIAPFFAVLQDPGLVDRQALLRGLHLALGRPDPHRFVVVLGALFTGLVFLSNLVNLLGSSLLNRLALRIGHELRVELYSDYIHRGYRFHARRNASTLFNNVTYEMDRVTNGVLQQVFVLTTNSIAILMIFASLVLLNPVVASGVAALLGGAYALIYLAARRGLRRAGEIHGERYAEQARLLSESLGAIKEILIRHNQAAFQHRFARSSRAVARAMAYSNTVAQSPRPIIECVAVAGLVGVALALSGRGGADAGWLVPLSLFGLASYRLLPALQQVFAALVRLRADRAAVATLVTELDRARSAPPAPADPGARWPIRPPHAIELEGVTFRYSEDRPYAVRELSLKVPAGSLVGLVGANGSGKTTVLDLMAGLLVPERGRLLVDGAPVGDHNRAAWQAALAYVPQSPFLLDGTVAENIALGVEREAIDADRLREAARLAQAATFIEALPRGYETVLGDRGIGLSGGQRQRVAIARALYHDAPVLLLDEPTSALDGDSEGALTALLAGMRGERTIVVVAHRLAALDRCDRIFELDGGALGRVEDRAPAASRNPSRRLADAVSAARGEG